MFRVSWCPATAIVSLAQKRGMTNGSVWDYVEEYECSVVINAISFAAAIRLAKEVIDEDISGEVRIARAIKVRCGVVGFRWQEDALWHMSDKDITPIEAEPDHRPDLDLDDDEEII